MENNTIKNKIAEAIKTGQVVMKPRWHFILKSALIITGTGLITLALIFFTSLVAFVLAESGALGAPGFGLFGLRIFLMSLPWAFVLLSFAFIVVLEILFRRYSFAYRQPLLYSVLILVLLALLGGVLVAQTPFHRGLFKEFGDGRVPFAGPLYRRADPDRLANIHPGFIKELNQTGFILSDPKREEIWLVNITPETRGNTTTLKVGEGVVVFGPTEDNQIKALGIKPFGPRPDWKKPMK